MEEGALLLIDEIDRGSNKIMCLQGVLEGKPVLIKKTGETVTPAAGFNVIATANTKGRGSEDGRFSAATIIDDAFLERFVSAINQPFPSKGIEKKIVANHMDKFDCRDEDFLDKLATWAAIIRKTFEVDGVDEVISTRRLCHIVKTFSIFKDRVKSIEMCTNRFDVDTITAFSDLYSKIDAGELTDEVNEEQQIKDDINYHYN
jgi:MoxR-like ATPase